MRRFRKRSDVAYLEEEFKRLMDDAYRLVDDLVPMALERCGYMGHEDFGDAPLMEQNINDLKKALNHLDEVVRILGGGQI